MGLIAGPHTSGSPSGSSWSASPGTLGQEWEDLCRQKCFQLMSGGLVYSLHLTKGQVCNILKSLGEPKDQVYL